MLVCKVISYSGMNYIEKIIICIKKREYQKKLYTIVSEELILNGIKR